MNIIPRKTTRDAGSFFPELRSLRSEMNSFFDQLFQGTRLHSAALSGQADWFPSMDVKDGDREFTVTCDVPGVNVKDIDVSLKGDVLTIKGEKKAESVEDAEGYYVTERSFGSFLRRIQLPEAVDSDSIKAEQKDGVLTVKLKKNLDAAQKKIPVSNGK